MSAPKTLKVSIIIPAYNEEHRIAACLGSIQNQTVKPYEVILVDNNCTDRTVAIAKRFKFVKVVREPVQGRAAARNRGFNTAKGDIFGRIDADSRIAPDWVATVQQSFADYNIVGLTGPGYSLALPRIRKPLTTVWSRLYFLWTEIFFRVPVLWGANMALSAKAWRKIKTRVSDDDRSVHEDHDISLVLQAYAGKLLYNPNLVFVSHSQAYHYFPKLIRYIAMRHSGRAYHRRIGTFNKLQPTVPRWKSFLYYFFGWPIIFIFLLASFLSWPLDLLIYKIAHRESWLS